MGSPYQSQSASGYNSSPPPDDGSTVAANKITWATTIKAKLADPIKTLADAINTALRTALNVSPSTTSIAYTTLVGDHLTTIEATGTFTVSLGDAATMIAQAMGYTVTVYNKGIGVITVGLITGTNTLNGTVGGTLVVPPKTAATFSVSQSGVGYNVIGSGSRPITLATEQASTSGTAITFGSLPTGLKRVTIMFRGVSTNGTSGLYVQLNGASSGYLGAGVAIESTTVAVANATVGFVIPFASAASLLNGSLTLTIENDVTFVWTCNGKFARSDTNSMYLVAGSVDLAATLSSLAITSVNGTDAFDAGVINIAYE